MKRCPGTNCIKRITCAHHRVEEADEPELIVPKRYECPNYMNLQRHPGPFWSWGKHLAEGGLLRWRQDEAEYLRALGAESSGAAFRSSR